MDGTKESDLITAVLMYAIRCLAEGDQAALRNMNFGPREIEALREMNLADLYRVATCPLPGDRSQSGSVLADDRSPASAA